MADFSFAELVDDYAGRIATTASAALDIVADASAKAEAGNYDAKEASASSAKLVAVWVAAWLDCLRKGRSLGTSGAGQNAVPIAVTVVLTGGPASAPSLVLEGPMRSGFNAQMPTSAVKIVQVAATASTHFSVELVPPPALTGVFRGAVIATWTDGTTKSFEVAIQVR